MPQAQLGQQVWAQEFEEAAASATSPNSHWRQVDRVPMSSQQSPLKRAHEELEVSYLTAENDSASGPSGGATPRGERAGGGAGLGRSHYCASAALVTWLLKLRAAVVQVPSQLLCARWAPPLTAVLAALGQTNSAAAVPAGSSEATSGTYDSRPPKRERVDAEEAAGPKEESWAETLCGEVRRAATISSWGTAGRCLASTQGQKAAPPNCRSSAVHGAPSLPCQSCARWPKAPAAPMPPFMQVGRLSLADTACMLTVAIHAASGGAANPAALRQLVARTGLRLVRAVSPLHEFLERRDHLDLWSALPLEVVEVRGAGLEGSGVIRRTEGAL